MINRRARKNYDSESTHSQVKVSQPATTQEVTKPVPGIPVTELLTLTVAQTATLLGWRRQLIDQAIHAGHIRPLNYPGVTRISRKELERYIESITER